jgi:hypothetical protein
MSDIPYFQPNWERKFLQKNKLNRAGLIVSDLQVPVCGVIICNEHHP